MAPLETDPVFLLAFRQGKRDVLEKVYWNHVAAVERCIRGNLRQYLGQPPSVDQVADLVQDIFARAFAETARRAYDGLRPYQPFLLTVARNTVIDQLRRSGREIPSEDAFLEAQIELERDAGEDWADAWTRRVVEEYLAALSPELQAVHRLRYVEGLPQVEAAAALSIGRQQLRRLEAMLHAGLKQALSKPSPQERLNQETVGARTER